LAKTTFLVYFHSLWVIKKTLLAAKPGTQACEDMTMQQNSIIKSIKSLEHTVKNNDFAALD